MKAHGMVLENTSPQIFGAAAGLMRTMEQNDNNGHKLKK
jgi:hypothetical protein